MTWDQRFLSLAREVSTWSKDPSTKIGAVITDANRRILGLGYNGFPRGVADTVERLNDRPTKYKYVVHGEVNAILNCEHRPVGATLYLWPGIGVCHECAKVIIQAGIKRVVCDYQPSERWSESTQLAADMMQEAGVLVIAAFTAVDLAA